jgi:hypothetical protein
LWRRKDRLLFIAALFFIFWVIGVIGTLSLWQSRLLLPAIMLLIPALAGSLVMLAHFDYRSFSIQRMMNVVMALVLAVTLVTQVTGLLKVNPFPFLVGAESREQFLSRQLGTHAEAMNAVAALPSMARAQLMWEPRSYFAWRKVRADPLLDALPHLIAKFGSVRAAAQQLKAAGFTHVLVYDTGVTRAIILTPDLYSAGDKAAVGELEREYGNVIYENADYRLLELK